MRGQFFLVGALLLILLFYIGISAYIYPSYAGPQDEGIVRLFGNIKDEYPRAFNFGMNISSPANTLVNFTNFVMNVTGRRGFETRILWVITENVNGNLNVTAGNFLGYPVAVNLSIAGEGKSINVGEGETNSSLFLSPPSEFELRLSFNTTEKNVLLEKYKANLYLILDMRKGDDRLAGEVKA